MENKHQRTITLYRAAVAALFTAVIVLGLVTFKAMERKNLVETAVTGLCGQALTNIELNLRQGDSLEPEYFYRLHEITRVYPDTNYAVLAEVLLPLTEPELSDRLSPKARQAMADCILKTNDPQILNDELEPLIYEIEIILAPYLYP